PPFAEPAGGHSELKRRQAPLAPLCALVLSALASPAGAQDAPDVKPLRWGADAEGGAPYIFKDPNNPQKDIGFEVDLAAALAKELRRPVVFTQYDFKNLVPGLDRGDFDFA